jgi:hypothetical protein
MTLNEWSVAYYLALGWTPEPAMWKAASLDEFKRELKAASDKVWELKKLRGADSDPTLKEKIAEIEKLLKERDDEAQAAVDAAEVDEAKAKLKEITTKAKAAEERAKTLDADSAKDLESMAKYLATLETARRNRDTIAGLPGAKAQLVEMDKLLLQAQAQITKNGTVSHGYTEGLKTLAGHAAILKQAQKASDEFKKKELPDKVKAAYKEAKDELEEYGKTGLDFQAKLFEKEIKEAAEGGVEDEKSALKGLQEISDAIKEATSTQTKLKARAEKEQKAVNKLLQELKTEDVPFSAQSGVMDKMKQAEGLMADDHREYQPAIDLLEECESASQSILDAYKKGGKEWTKKAKAIPDIQKTGKRLAAWPPLKSRAMQLLKDAEALEKKVPEEVEYAKASEELDKLVARKTALEADAEKSGMPEKDSDLKEYRKACEEATSGLQKAYKVVLVQIEKLEAALKKEGVKNPTGTKFQTDADSCWEKWSKSVQLPTRKVYENLDKEERRTLEEFKAIETGIKALLKKPDELEKIKEKLKKDEEAKAESERPERIQNLLIELKRLKIAPGKDVESDVNKVLAEAAGGRPSDRNRAKQIEERLAETLANGKKEFQKKQNERKAELAEVRKGLNKVKDNNFEAYGKQLDTQADDIDGLINSGDPDLLELAAKEMEALKKRKDALDPKNRPKDAKTFGHVEEKHAELAKLLGKDNLISKRLPDTFAKLRDELESTLVKARESDPETGCKAFEELEKSIKTERENAVKADSAYQHFKEIKKAVEAHWSDIKKQTHTWITDRAKAYEAKFKTRLAEANKTAHEQGKLNEATETLMTITRELEAIGQAPDPRRALQDEDAAAKQEQKFVIDMVRQFQARLKIYQKTTLVELRKVLNGVEGADTDQLDSLEKVGSQAERIVEPYLNIVSKLPHKSLAANSAPPMDKAKEDFAMAHKMLEDATRTARSMQENPEGVNVKFTGDLKRIGEEWTKNTMAYAAAVKALGAKIKEDGKDQKGDLKKKCDEVGALLESEAPHFFNPKVFEKPLGALTKKENGAGDRNALLAAREKALRTVRRYRKEILTDPLLVKINSRDNPFQPLTRKAGAVRATLKRLELELLGAV